MKKRHTVLVVDDEPDVVQSVQGLLRLEFRVIGATRAQEGLKILQTEEVHVVMSDQRMPEMTGVEFLSKVKGEHTDAIRLLFTGYADIRAVIDAINQGNVYRYITKPWDPDELQAIIRQATQQYDLLVERKRLLAELQVKNRELEKANELKAAFIRVASHELRTPLTILCGLSELALLTPDVSGPLLEWMQSIHQAGQRLNRLVNQILKMLHAGKFERPLCLQPIDLAALIRQAAEDVQPFVKQRKQSLELDLAADLGHVHVEADMIRDSIDHLLINAIKFTPDLGRIQIGAHRTADHGAEITVRDEGIGIEPANLAHVFDSFFTEFNVSRHSSGQYEFNRRGMGLGLALVKAFVELHRGTVTVASTPGKGTTFTVTLPAGDKEARSA
jgi:signal transduction histidine kinase